MCGRFLLLTDEENIELSGIIKAIEEKYPDRNVFALGEMFPGAVIPVLANMGNESGCGVGAGAGTTVGSHSFPVDQRRILSGSHGATTGSHCAAADPHCATADSQSVTADSCDAEWRMQPFPYEPFLMHWGFPFLGKARSSQVINAKSETLTEKPMFRRLVDEHRCIIPASAFYEWAHVSGAASSVGSSSIPIGASSAKNKKIKLMIRPSSARTAKGAYYFYMAGLTSKLRLFSGSYADCTVIITTRPSAQMAEIHNRMPVMLDRAMADYWLSNAGIDKIYGSGIMEPWNGSLDIVSVQ